MYLSNSLNSKGYSAPEPCNTAGIVFVRILRSNHSDHRSIYSMSSSIQLKGHRAKGMEHRANKPSYNKCYSAPEPCNTAGIVFVRILRSSHKDQVSMYSISSCIHCSKGMELLPLTCQRQVMPGRTLKRRRCQSWSKPL